jgi:hypothetical protein
MRFFRFVSFLSAAFPSKAALTFALTFCRKDETSLTLTSDSSSAAVISLSVVSKTFAKASIGQLLVNFDHQVIDRLSRRQLELG